MTRYSASSSTPSTRRMSCGTGLPSISRSPRSTIVAFLDGDALALRDQVLDRLRALAFRHDQDAALGLVVLAELDAARDVADDREILRLARLEQLGHARQTAGDVAGLAALARDTREDVAGMDLLAVLDREDRVDRQQVARLLRRWPA